MKKPTADYTATRNLLIKNIQFYDVNTIISNHYLNIILKKKTYM